MSGKKITYIVSDMSKMITLEWICDYRHKDLTELSFIFLNKGPSEIETFVAERGYKFIRIPYFGKKDLLKALWRTFWFLKNNKSHAVHCHLFDACIVGLSAAFLAGVKKRIYTRHYATYHHVYFPKAVKYDLFMNRLATHIVAISELVKNVLLEKEKVNPKKVWLINHGFLFSEYASASDSRITTFKSKFGIQEGDIIIGVIARFTLLKGIQHILPAFQRFLKEYPRAKLLIANGLGNDEAYIRSLMKDIPQSNIIEVKYERDMGALYRSLDLYIHVPIYDHIEAFGQTYVEALMAGVPSVFTMSGIAQEFIVNEKNALVVPFEESEPIYKAMKRIMEDEPLRSRLIEQGIKDTQHKFGLDNMVNSLEELYLS